MNKHETTEPVIHQAIHGYRHGHQLLASSTNIDDDLAVALANYSDSASRSRSSEGAYLTGYSRPDGTYILARTWPVQGAERPNTVITRSLIVPPKAVGKVDGAYLDSHLGEPRPDERDLPPIPVASSRQLLRLSVDEAELAVTWYLTSHPLSGLSGASRDRVALALWTQLWMPARRELWFCTVPDTQRFAERKRSLRFTSEPSDRPASSMAAVWRMPIDDLVEPGAFRSFVHFVGSGQRSPSLMVSFATAFGLFEKPREGAIPQFTALLDQVGAAQPDRLRRLKRRFLGFERSEPRWAVDPFALLGELVEGALGGMIYTADASLDRWIALWWETDAARTASMIGRSASPVVDVPLQRRTVREDLSDAFHVSAVSLVTPATLGIAAEIDRYAARAALWERGSEDLWKAWLTLPNRSWYLDQEHDGTRFRPAVRALRSSPDGMHDFLKKHPDAVIELIDEVGREPRDVDLAIDLPGGAARRVQDLLEQGDERVAALLRLANPSHLPRRLSSERLVRALGEGNSEAGILGLAYLIARRGDDELLTTAAARAFSGFYDALASRAPEGSWAKVSPVLRGDRASWDRCGRLAEDFAHELSGRPSNVRDAVLENVGRLSKAAHMALATATASKSKKRGFSLLNPFGL